MTCTRYRKAVLFFLLGLVLGVTNWAASQTLEFQDWESGNGGWTTDGDIWEVGQPSEIELGAYSGSKCAATVLGGNYPNFSNTRLVSPIFTVPPASEVPIFRFWHWYSILEGDWGRVQISVNGGGWQNLVDTFYTGQSNGWEYDWINLSAYGGNSVQIAFYFGSSENDTSLGWYIDDISLTTGIQVAVTGLWSIEHHPYHIVANTTIDNLIIDPGVRVLFNGNYSLSVLNGGILSAIGTESDSIYFTWAREKNRWNGIAINDALTQATMKYCCITGSGNSGIRITNSTPLIDNCLLINNVGVDGGGININRTIMEDTLFIRNCSIIYDTSYRHGGAINAIENKGIFYLYNCDICSNLAGANSNSYGNSYGGGINFTSNADTGKMVIINCSLNNNNLLSQCYSNRCDREAYGGAICAVGDIQIESSQISDNYCYGAEHGSAGISESGRAYGGGVYIEDGDLLLNNSIIIRNRAHGHGAVGRTYGGGLCAFNSHLKINNSLIAFDSCFVSYGADIARYGGGLFADNLCTADLINCIIYDNNLAGIQGPNIGVTIMNSVIYENDVQTSGNFTITFSDIQGINTQEPGWNIDCNPEFINDAFELSGTSCCIDAGNPQANYNDINFPPSQGTARNDIGIWGGPGAIQGPIIQCPVTDLNIEICELGQEICFPLNIAFESTVEVFGAAGSNWSDDVLCFTANNYGYRDFTIVATNGNGADTCFFTVYVSENLETIAINTDFLAFIATEDDGELPAPKSIEVTSLCPGIETSVRAAILTGADVFEIANPEITTPNNIEFKVLPAIYTPGIYTGSARINEMDNLISSRIVAMALFMGAGVDVGDYYVTETGKSFAVPIKLYTDTTLQGFTIPLKIKTTQPDKFVLDSVIVNPLVGDLINTPLDSGWIICERPIQEPPLPDSTSGALYNTAYAYFTAKEGITSEVIVIDTATISYGGFEYNYNFIPVVGDLFVPNYDQGNIFVTLPNEIVLLSPVNGQGYVSDDVPVVTFEWEADLNSTFYEFEIYDSTTEYLSRIYTTNCSSNSHQINSNSIICPNGYFWHVRGINNQGACGQWSESRIISISTDVAEIPNDNLPKEFALGGNYPNPFNPSTTIRFSLPQRATVALEIFNILGQKVTILHEGELAAGHYQATWDGTDGRGNGVSTGIYLYRLKAGEFVQTRKMLLLK